MSYEPSVYIGLGCVRNEKDIFKNALGNGIKWINKSYYIQSVFYLPIYILLYTYLFSTGHIIQL